MSFYVFHDMNWLEVILSWKLPAVFSREIVARISRTPAMFMKLTVFVGRFAHNLVNSSDISAQMRTVNAILNFYLWLCVVFQVIYKQFYFRTIFKLKCTTSAKQIIKDFFKTYLRKEAKHVIMERNFLWDSNKVFIHRTQNISYFIQFEIQKM